MIAEVPFYSVKIINWHSFTGLKYNNWCFFFNCRRNKNKNGTLRNSKEEAMANSGFFVCLFVFLQKHRTDM